MSCPGANRSTQSHFSHQLQSQRDSIDAPAQEQTRRAWRGEEGPRNSGTPQREQQKAAQAGTATGQDPQVGTPEHRRSCTPRNITRHGVREQFLTSFPKTKSRAIGNRRKEGPRFCCCWVFFVFCFSLFLRGQKPRI